MSHSVADRTLVWVLRAAAAICGAVLLLIAVFLVAESMDAFRHVGPLRFFTDGSWHPAREAASGQYDLTPMLLGTVLAMLGAVAIAGPLGIGIAVFCHYYAPAPIAGLYRRVLGLLAGIPSVVYGFWGLVVLVPLIRHLAPPGPSLLAGVLILAVMILPTIALVADSSLTNVPRAVLLGASALGMSRFATVVGVALPAARSGLVTATLLGAGRAIGETMAILMVCGNVVSVPDSLFDPVRTLTANMALEMAYALDDHRSALYVSGLMLLAMIVLLVAAVERLDRSGARA